MAEPKNKTPLPHDWHETAPHKTVAQLRRYYGFEEDVVYRMLRETGIEAAKYKNSGGKPPNPAEVARFRERRQQEAAASAASRAHIDAAANKLRRRYPSVFRCDIAITEKFGKVATRWGDTRGMPNGGAGHYYVEGIGTVTDAELIQMASQQGD